MPVSPTPRWGLDCIDPSQVGADVTHNTALNKLDPFLNHVSVINSSTSAPPGSPTNGDLYLTSTGCTGAWATHDTQLALYYNGWIFFALKFGLIVYDVAGNTLKLWQSGSTWRTL